MPATWTTLVADVHSRFDAALPPLLADYGKSGGRLYCAAGCDSCCTLHVGATLAEAAIIAARLPPHLVAPLADYLQRLAPVLEGCAALKDYLGRHRSEVGPCPFLGDDRRCQIYPLRPLACRALLSTRNHQWCAVDFSRLHEGERQAYLSSLDPALVAFPTHYLAAPQELARGLEEELEARTAARCGFSLSGNLPLLVHLCRELDLPASPLPALPQVKELLAAGGWAHPFVVSLSD